MDIVAIVRSQYLASLEMLKQTIDKCPESIWNSPDDKTKFWNIAYHVLFYTHLYLQDTLQDFKPWPRHREEYQFLGQVPWPPHAAPKIGEPLDKEMVLDYLAFCQQQVRDRVPCLNFEAESGFDWLPFNKFELQLYNIRHLQQHTGELMERLGTRTGIELDWVGQMRG
jgi:hypothetical protein